MDKFDETIKSSQEIHEPSQNFVNETMSQVSAPPLRKGWSLKIWIPTLAGLAAVLAVIFIVIPLSDHKLAPKKATLTTSTQPQSGAATTTTPMAAGTDNAALNSDLTNIQGSINQENSDQSTANNGINDSQYEVTVPTS